MAGTPCWEYQKCDKRADCPAYPHKGFECWLVEGTLCRGERQQGYQQKIGDCRTLCGYYQGVMDGAIRVT